MEERVRTRRTTAAGVTISPDAAMGGPANLTIGVLIVGVGTTQLQDVPKNRGGTGGAILGTMIGTGTGTIGHLLNLLGHHHHRHPQKGKRRKI